MSLGDDIRREVAALRASRAAWALVVNKLERSLRYQPARRWELTPRTSLELGDGRLMLVRGEERVWLGDAAVAPGRILVLAARALAASPPAA